MERIVEQTLLYDFYGELLNEHQRNVYEDAVFNDLSLSEIADEYNISRQGVHDLIKRVSNTLEGYESKLHLIEKFMDTKAKVTKIDELVDSYIASPDMKLILEHLTVFQINFKTYLRIFAAKDAFLKLT